MTSPAQPHCPGLVVHCVIFGLDHVSASLNVLLVRHQPDHWALPGGEVRLDESLEDAASRTLSEESGLQDVFLEQLFTFGDPARDPRDRVIAVAYYALVNLAEHGFDGAAQRESAAWFEVKSSPALALDHSQILKVAVDRLRGKVSYQPIGFELLPSKFTLSQLQRLYEIILEQELDKRNFRKRILKMNLLIDLDEFQSDVAHRAARLYSFDKDRYQRLTQSGFSFEVYPRVRRKQ